MRCPYCHKSIEIEKEAEYNSMFTDHFYYQIINCIVPIMIIVLIGQFLAKWIPNMLEISMALMILVGLFYMVYGFLWSFGKVSGRLLIIKPSSFYQKELKE